MSPCYASRMGRAPRLPASLLVALLAATTSRGAEPGPGDPVPPVVLRTLDGTGYDLQELRGRVVVAKWGYTW